MNCPSHCPFLKLTHWSKLVFVLFLGDKGSFHYIFFQHHGYAVFYILKPRLFELIDHWHFAVVLSDSNCNRRSRQRALFSKYSHLPPPIWVTDWLWDSQITAWLFGRWHFIQTIFSCEAGSTQVNLSLSICAARCMHGHTNFTLPPPSPTHHFLFLLWLSDACTCSQTQSGNYGINKVLAKKQLADSTTGNMCV